MTDEELRAAAAALVFEVMGLEMPVPTKPTPSAGHGHDWSIDGHPYHDNGEPLELALAYFWDRWRRTQVERLVAERGLAPALVRLCWDRIPDESAPFREGWDAWAARRRPPAGPPRRPSGWRPD